MVAIVTEDGLLIPRYLLAGITTVELNVEADRVVVLRVPDSGASDSLLQLGSDPVYLEGYNDASDNHDSYIYSGTEE